MNKKQKKVVRVVVLIFAVIGVITVIDNGYRLVKEVSHTVQRHSWNLKVIR